MRGYVRKALELSPDSAGALLMLGWLNAAEGRLGEAVKAADEAIGISDEAWFRGFQAQIYALAGLKDRAREVLDGLLSNRFKGYPSPAQIGVVYYILGEKDEGFHWMEKAYNARDTSLAMNNNLPALKAAREDKRFIELLGRMGLS